MYGTLTGGAAPRRRQRCRSATRRPSRRPAGGGPNAGRGAPDACAAQARRMSRVAVLKGGRSLERQVSLRSGARVAGRARAARPRGDRGDRRRPRPRRPADRGAPGRRVRRAPRPRRRGRNRAGAARGDGHPLHRLGRVGLHPRGRQGAGQARDARSRHPDARLLRLQRDRASRRSGRRRRCRRSRTRLRFPIVVKPARQGSALGIKFARTAGRRADGAGRRVLLRPQGAARALRARARAGGLDPRGGRRAAGAADRRGGARGRRTSTTSRRATRSAARGSCAPPSSTSWRGRAGAGVALETSIAARLRRLRPRRPDAGRPTTGELYVLEAQPDPRPDRDQPAAAGRRRGRDPLRRARRADPRGAPAPRRCDPADRTAATRRRRSPPG